MKWMANDATSTCGGVYSCNVAAFRGLSGWARIPAIQAELKHRRKMSDLVELTAEHKTKIRLALFDMPRELRERYWKETNYGQHPNRITAHLLNAILER
jgi:hypothetical protein